MRVPGHWYARHWSGLFGALLGAIVIGAGIIPAAVQAASTNVVISAFRTRGPSGGNDELVELFNLSAAAVNIGDWKINGSNNAGTTSTRVTINTSTVLQPSQ